MLTEAKNKNGKEQHNGVLNICHNAGRILPLSLHNIILEAGVQVKLSLEDVVELRIYGESYLKSLNGQREKAANHFLTVYFEYLNSFSNDWAISVATTFRNYIINFMLQSTRNTILKWTR